MKQIRLYAYSYSDSSEFCFAALLLDSYKYAIKEEPNKFTTLKLHLKVKKWHTQDVLDEVFMDNCTLEKLKVEPREGLMSLTIANHMMKVPEKV